MIIENRIKRQRILESQLVLAEFARNEWHVTPEAGVTVEDMLKPEYWSHVTKKLQPGTLIQATAHDGSWHARFFVRSVKDLVVSIALLQKHEFGSDEALDEDQYEFKWAGPTAKFRIIRHVDKAVMVEGMESKDECAAWLKNPVAKAV